MTSENCDIFKLEVHMEDMAAWSCLHNLAGSRASIFCVSAAIYTLRYGKGSRCALCFPTADVTTDLHDE